MAAISRCSRSTRLRSILETVRWPSAGRMSLDAAISKPHSQAAFKAGAALLYATALARAAAIFPGSSVVEQPAVNRLVAGSNPARGAKQIKQLARSTSEPNAQ